MFDISFGELLVIGVVALVVLGPEKLPAVARTVGALVGRMQRFVNNVKSDIQREVDLQGLSDLKNDIQDAAQSFRDRVENESREMRGTFDQMGDDLRRTGEEARAALSDQPANDTAEPDAPSPGDIPTENEASPEPEVDDRQLTLSLDEPDEPSVYNTRRTPSR